MKFHVTYIARDRTRQIGRIHAGSRTEAIRNAAAAYMVPQRHVVSAVAIPEPRAVTPYPEVLTPGQG